MIKDIAKTLYLKFSHPIHTEKITQNFSAPAFTIEEKKRKEKQVQKNRFFVDSIYHICFYTNEKDLQKSLTDMQGELLSTLSIIPTKTGSIKPIKKEAQIKKDFIECKITFQFYGYKEKGKSEIMKKLEITK